MQAIARRREGTDVSADAIRGYFIGLRQSRRITQEQVAAAAGMTRRAWIDYEKKRTQEISGTTMLAVLRFLDGSFAHLKELASDEADEAMGLALAAQRAEEIASGEVAALRETLSEEEFNQFLAEIDQMLASSGRILPRLRDALGRVRRGRRGPSQ